MKKITKLFSHRSFYVAAALILQIVVLVLTMRMFMDKFVYIYTFLDFIGLFVVLTIYDADSHPSYKIAWIVTILALPIFGTLFYLMFGTKRTNRGFIKKMSVTDSIMQKQLPRSDKLIEELQKTDSEAANRARYINNFAFAPAYSNSDSCYLPSGEDFFSKLMPELRKAEKFIFMEYFIIEDGLMWSSVLEVLKQKAAAGLDVRVMFDDVGCLFTLPDKYDEELRKFGIKCVSFNKFVPLLSLRLNNRDHRKITVVDGNVGFTGGMNLADEYINEYEKYGHWKDTGVMLTGQAVDSLTVMFLSMWDVVSAENSDYKKYKHSGDMPGASQGIVQPFSDSPLDDEHVSETVYLRTISTASSYLYLTTPYLVIGNELLSALRSAAKCGVDVRIITPHIPDKWYVHEVSRSHYEQLTKNKVRIFEYTPGFIHSKSIVADDKTAVVGTINLDYRSMYLHFECGTMLYDTPEVMRIKEDFLSTLELCEEVTYEQCLKVPRYKKFFRSLLRMFAPLM